jgi:hypothetical protein
MTLAERLDELLGVLPSDWSLARVALTVTDPAKADRTALILGPLSPGRSGASFTLSVSASGTAAPSVDAVRRVLGRLDAEEIDARLSLPGTAAFQVAPRAPEPPGRSLAGELDELLARLPADWSDLYLEVELASSDDLERAALLLGPANPFLEDGPRPALRFRAARRFGYGVAPEMARRVLARLDEDGIAGTLRLLRMQADVHPAHTQGLVWREAGRAI